MLFKMKNNGIRGMCTLEYLSYSLGAFFTRTGRVGLIQLV